MKTILIAKLLLDAAVALYARHTLGMCIMFAGFALADVGALLIAIGR